jgi:uncharacterized protein YuzE
MESLPDAFGDLYEIASEALRQSDQLALETQLSEACIARVTFDTAANAGYIYLQRGAERSRSYKANHGPSICNTILLDTHNYILLDTDDAGRLVGIELISPPNHWKTELKRRAGAE